MALGTVIHIDPLGDPRWDEFVRSHPRAMVYHLSTWGAVLAGAYRYRPSCLALEREGRLRAVLPLAARRGPITSRRLRSLPVAPIAGPLGDTDEHAAALLDAAAELAERRGRELSVDSLQPGLDRYSSRTVAVEIWPTWVLPVPDGPSGWATWEAQRSKNLRRDIRRSERAGVTVREGTSERDLRAFYGLYLATMRKHGSLPRPFRGLRLAQSLMQPTGIFRLFLAERKGRVTAGGVFHVFNGTVEILYNASDDASLEHHPNHALYRHALAWASEHGHRRFDFGYAPTTSLARFKARWGAEPESVFRYIAQDGTGPPPGPDQAELPSPSRSRDVWSKVPLPLTAAAGDLLHRWL